MKKKFPVSKPARCTEWLLAVSAATLLSACGGGGAGAGAAADAAAGGPQLAAQLASGTTILSVDIPALPAAVAQQAAQPAFHAAPMLLDAPEDADAATQVRRGPHRHVLSAEFAGLSTRRLTVQGMEAARHRRSMGAGGQAGNAAAAMLADGASAPMADGVPTPMATGSVIATYTPAQIRAAYGLPALPAAGAALSAVQAAQLGAGQTIYLVDAMHDPSAVAELAAFNLKFGLPACTTKTLATTISLPLAAAGTGGCEFSVVFNTASGALTSTQPAYNSGWAMEIALDVQWAHATAPLARIILIEAPDASLNSLLGSVKLANAMGPGVVSMSFGASEGSWTASVDSAFTGANMSYLAATGDSGAAVCWPAVSPNVVAVGGTTLTYSGTGARSEVGWSGTGGGTSLYTPTPGYQSNTVPGLGSPAHRTVADVSFNADPASGQYTAIVAPGSSTVSWLSIGGTSLATPQWAGLIAVANATRSLAAKPALGAPHAMLYGQIASVPGTYASVFADVTKGSDGSCATCSSRVGYDQLSGLGTPNVGSLLSALSGSTAAATAPVVTSAGISGKVGTALSFTVAATAPNPVTYTLSGAPSGMTIASTGAVTWAAPVAGTYPVTVTAKDSKTGLSGQGLYAVVIAALPAPVLTSASISGKVGIALSFTVAATAPNPVTYTLSGAPSGMSIASTGIVTWIVPVVGNYPVTVTAKDGKTGLSGQGLYSVSIAASAAPVVASASISGKPGIALAFTVAVTAPNSVTYALTGAPSGMLIATTGVVTWANPVAGTFAVTVVAKDGKTGLSGQGAYTVKISAAGPVVTAAAITGVAGKPASGTITFSAPGATSLSISISGAPMGMTFSASGMSILAYCASPVAGSYSLAVTVADSAGLSANIIVPVTINAK